MIGAFPADGWRETRCMVQPSIARSEYGPPETPVVNTPAPTATSRALRAAFIRIGVVGGVAGAIGTMGLLLAGAPFWLGIVLGPAAGGLLASLLIPHRWLASRDADERALEHMESTLRRLSFEGRRAPMSSVLVDRPGVVGALSRSIHARLIEALAQHAEARLLKRTIDVTIERRTKLATADLSRLARTDPLTGLGNRRALEESLVDLYQHSASPRMTFTVVLIDLDHFKSINDSLGHDVGDEILRHLADCLLSTLRKEDVAARLGGDEFIILLPGITEREAETIAERIRQLFNQMPWRHEDVRRATLSIGIATARDSQRCPAAELIRRADQALYTAKSDGRNATATHNGGSDQVDLAVA